MTTAIKSSIVLVTNSTMYSGLDFMIKPLNQARAGSGDDYLKYFIRALASAIPSQCAPMMDGWSASAILSPGVTTRMGYR